MATGREIVVRIVTDLAALRSGMAQATGVIAGAASKATGLSTALGDIQRAAHAAGIQLALIGAAGTAAFGSAAKSAVDFEKNMALVVALTGVEQDEIAGLTERMKPLAISTGTNLNDMAQAFYFAASAVSDTDTAFDILQASAIASAGGLGDLTIVVDAVSSAVNAYTDSGLTAARATDVLVQTVRDGKAEPEALAGAFGKVLPVASAMGLSFEEVGANLAIMTRVGMSADESSTALKATLTQLLKPGDEAVQLLASMGMSMDEVRKSIRERGLLATLNDMIDATGGNVDQLAILFPNVRALTDVLGSAVAQGDAYAEVLNNMNMSAGAAQDAFSTMAGTNAMNIARLKAMLSVLSVEIGAILLPTIYELTDALQTFVSRLRALTQEHPEITKFVVMFGAIASVTILVVGALLLFVSAAAGGLKALVDMSILGGKAAGAMWRLAGGLAQAALDAATFATKMALTAWDALARNAGTAATNIWSFARGLAEAARHPDIKTKIQLDQAFGTGVTNKAYQSGAKVGGAFNAGFKGILSGLGSVVGGALGSALGPRALAMVAPRLAIFATGFAAMFSSATAAAMGLMSTPIGIAIVAVLVAALLIYKYREPIWKALTGLFDILREFFTEAVPQWFEENFTAGNVGRMVGMAAGILIIALFPIPFLIIKFREQIMGFLSDVGSFIAGIPGMAAAFIGDHWQEILFAIFPIPMAIVKWHEEIGNFIAQLAGMVAGIPGRIAAFVADHWKEILVAIFSVPMAIIKWREDIGKWLGEIAGFVAGIPGKIGAFVADHWKEIIGAIIDIPKWSVEFTSKASSFVADIIPKIPGLFAGVGIAIAQGIKDAFFGLIDFAGWFKELLHGAWNALPGPVRDFVEGIGGGIGEVLSWAGLQKGALNFLGGLAMVGEHGPELMRLPRGTDVIKNENLRQAVRDAGGAAGGGRGALNIAVNIAANFGNWAELRRQILAEVEEQLDEGAARAGLSQPRFGTLGAGIPRS